MTKITKRIMLAVCSLVFVLCLGITATLGLNTNKAVAADADTTVTFVGVEENQHNKQWQVASWQATYLNFEGGTFTGANGGATSGSITYTRSGEGSETNFVVWSAAGTGQLQLLWETYNSFADGSTIHIEEGTVVDGLTLPEVTLEVVGDKWQEKQTEDSATSASFTGIVEGYNFNPYTTDRHALLLEFDKPMGSTVISSLVNDVAENVLNITLNGKAVTIDSSHILARCMKVGSNPNVLELVFFNYDTTGHTFAEGVTSPFANNTKLEIKDSTVNGYALEDVTLYFNATTSTWQTEEISTEAKKATFTGILGQDMSGTVWEAHSVLHLGFDQTLATEGVTLSDSNLNGALKMNGVAATGINLMAKGFVAGGNALEVLFKSKKASDFAAGDTLTIDEGALFNGFAFSEVTVVFDGEKWAVPASEVAPTVSFVGIGARNYDDWTGTGTFNATYLEFSGALTAGLYAGDSTTGIYYTDSNGENKKSFGFLWVQEGEPNGPDQTTYMINAMVQGDIIPNGSILQIEENTEFAGQILPEVTLYLVDGNWQKEPASETPESPVLTEVEFVEFNASYNNGTYPWGDGLYGANVLYFDKPLYSEAMESTSVMTMGDLATNLTINGKTAQELDVKVTFAVLSTDGKNGLEFYFLKANMPKFSEEVSQIVLEIKEGTKFLNNILPSLKFYLNAEEEWQTEEYTHVYVPPVQATFTEVSADFNNRQNPWREEYYLSAFVFSDVLSIKAVGDGAGLIGEKLELNGVKASELGFLFSTTENSTTMNVQYPKTAIPTLSEELTQIKLTLLEAVEFGNVILQPFTLYMNELGKWQTEEHSYEPPQEVTFVEFGVGYNNGTYPFGDGLYGANVLYFDAPLYSEAMDTALVELVNGNLATNLTINGVTAKDLGIAVTFAVLSEESRNGLEFYFAKTNMPKFENDGDQIILEIKEGTKFLNNILPALKFYLNDYEEWQTEEYSYEYQPTKEITFVEVSFDYNNHQNPWREDYYLSAFVFSDILSKKAVGDGAGLIGEKLELNGVKVSELGFLLSTTEYSTTMNVQYPKESLHSVINTNRQVRLVLTEEVAFGDVIIKPFRLYWNENRWELIDETDKTAPVISYDGETEIQTTEGKAFVIDISAFDNEDNAACVLYYDWSVGALDENSNLIKGNHTCTVTAIDKAGNEAKLVVTVNVGDKDTEKPVITAPDTVTVFVGAIPEFEYSATDNFDGEIICQVSWSDGALDADGKLVAGTHTMTLTATDLSGNVATKEVTVIVTSLDIGGGDSTDPDDSSSAETPDSSDSSSVETPDSSSSSSDATSDGDSSSVGSSGTDSTSGCSGCSGSVSGLTGVMFCAAIMGVGMFIKKKNKKDDA